MSILSMKRKSLPAGPLAEAEAAVEAAAGRRIAAREKVDEVVSEFPPGMRDVRAIFALQPTPPISDPSLDHMRSADDRAARARRSALDDARKVQEGADREYEAAAARRDALRRDAEVAAFGDGRAALRTALADIAKVSRAADEVRAAVAKARGRLVAAQTAHSRAESLLAEARERAIGDEHQIASLADLRRAEADARDDAALAAEALRRAELALVDRENAERTARERALAAAHDVIAMYAGPAWIAVEHARIEVRRREQIFSELAFYIRTGSPADMSGLCRRRSEIVHYFDPASNAARAEANAFWSNAQAALLNDPDALLPDL